MNSEPEICNSFWLRAPSTIVVCGPSKSKKTTIAAKLCQQWTHATENGQDLVDCYLFYDSYQEQLYDKIKHSCSGKFEASQGYPANGFGFLECDQEEYTDPKRGRVLILDDMAINFKNPQKAAELQRLFAVLSHHMFCSVLLLVQDLDKPIGTVLKNTDYLILTKGHQDYVSLGRKLFSGQPGVLRDAAHDTFYKLKRDYIIVDNTADTEPQFRIKTGLFEDEPFSLLFKPV